MSASKYLPPFTVEERGAIAGERALRTPADPGTGITDPEATYADFLGDEVDE